MNRISSVILSCAPAISFVRSATHPCGSLFLHIHSESVQKLLSTIIVASFIEIIQLHFVICAVAARNCCYNSYKFNIQCTFCISTYNGIIYLVSTYNFKFSALRQCTTPLIVKQHQVYRYNRVSDYTIQRAEYNPDTELKLISKQSGVLGPTHAVFLVHTNTNLHISGTLKSCYEDVVYLKFCLTKILPK